MLEELCMRVTVIVLSVPLDPVGPWCLLLVLFRVCFCVGFEAAMRRRTAKLKSSCLSSNPGEPLWCGGGCPLKC